MVNGTVPAREESLQLQQEEARWGREAEDGGAVVAYVHGKGEEEGHCEEAGYKYKSSTGRWVRR